MEDKELIIRQTVLLEEIGKKITIIENNIMLIKDDHIVKTRERLGIAENNIQDLKDDIVRAKKFNSALLAGLIIAFISMIATWITKK